MIPAPPIDVVITREYLVLLRQSLLMQLDALERLMEISPRTAELRKEAKAQTEKDKVVV